MGTLTRRVCLGAMGRINLCMHKFPPGYVSEHVGWVVENATGKNAKSVDMEAIKC